MSSDKKAEFGPKFGVGTPLYRHHTTSLVFNDPPLHTRVRKLLAAAFTPRALASLQPRIEAVVDGLLERHADEGRMDLVEDFAFRLPVEVILPPALAQLGPLKAAGRTVFALKEEQF